MKTVTIQSLERLMSYVGCEISIMNHPLFYFSSKDKDYRCRTSEDLIRGLPRDRSYNGPLIYAADRPNSDYRPTNLAQGTSRTTSGMPKSDLVLFDHLVKFGV